MQLTVVPFWHPCDLQIRSKSPIWYGSVELNNVTTLCTLKRLNNNAYKASEETNNVFCHRHPDKQTLNTTDPLSCQSRYKKKIKNQKKKGKVMFKKTIQPIAYSDINCVFPLCLSWPHVISIIYLKSCQYCDDSVKQGNIHTCSRYQWNAHATPDTKAGNGYEMQVYKNNNKKSA